jgi:hypothetical protein
MLMAARAQQPAGRLPRIGILYFGWNENIAAFLQGLRDGGYIEGTRPSAMAADIVRCSHLPSCSRTKAPRPVGLFPKPLSD